MNKRTLIRAGFLFPILFSALGSIVCRGKPVAIGLGAIYRTPDPPRKGAGSTPEAARKVTVYPRKVCIELLPSGLPKGVQVHKTR